MNDELRARADVVEQAVDPDPNEFHFCVKFVDEDGNVTSVIGDTPEDTDEVSR